MCLALQGLQVPSFHTYVNRLTATARELWTGLQSLAGVKYLQKQQELRDADGVPFTVYVPVNQNTMGKNDQHNYSVDVSAAFVDHVKHIDATCSWVNGWDARNQTFRLMLQGGSQLLYQEHVGHAGGRKWWDHPVTFDPSNRHVYFSLSGGGWGRMGPEQRGVTGVTLTVMPNALRGSAFEAPFAARSCPF